MNPLKQHQKSCENYSNLWHKPIIGGKEIMETTPINSIISEENFVINNMLKAQPEIRTGTALVFEAPEKELLVLRSGKLSGGEIKKMGFRKIYKIDITEKIYNTERSYYSGDDHEKFKLKISFNYAVADPAQIVNRAITDLNVVFESMLFRKLELLASKFEIDQRKEFSNRLEEMSNSTDWSKKILEFGIRVTDLYVTVLLSEELAKRKAEKAERAREKEEGDERLEQFKKGDKWDYLIRKAKTVEEVQDILKQKSMEEKEERGEKNQEREKTREEKHEDLRRIIEIYKELSVLGLDENGDLFEKIKQGFYGNTNNNEKQDKPLQLDESGLKEFTESEDEIDS
jgi:hypothetical protein